MQTLTEPVAARYAQAVVEVLASEFSALDETQFGGLGRLVEQDVAQHAAAPERLEVIVTYTREWRLVPDRTSDDRWRVQIACFIDDACESDRHRAHQINAALRAIQQ